jgi:2-hydroxy-6-oxonona-2,4-dienedioate hydrolase
MRRRNLLLATLAGTALIAAGGIGIGLSRSLAAARARLAGRSELFEGRFGAMEYAVEGDGPPVLMLHGTGGGFDQGLDMTRPLAAAGWRIVAPSRFGYLRSDFPADPSPANQAHACLDLLDRLGIDRVPVIGGSAGALSALELAIRHPDRCAALVALVPATHVPGRPAPRPPNALAAAIIRHGLRSDLLFWLGITLAEDTMIASLLATDPALVHTAAPDEQARVRAILRGILPISARARGLIEDGRRAGDPPPMDLGRIAAPTLALSLADDRFDTLVAARHIAATVPDGRLVSYPTGGHVWVGRDAEVFAEIDRFLRRHA